eukprot:UN25654
MPMLNNFYCPWKFSLLRQIVSKTEEPLLHRDLVDHMLAYLNIQPKPAKDDHSGIDIQELPNGRKSIIHLIRSVKDLRLCFYDINTEIYETMTQDEQNMCCYFQAYFKRDIASNYVRTDGCDLTIFI